LQYNHKTVTMNGSGMGTSVTIIKLIFSEKVKDIWFTKTRC
jgi:hypothetical protein